MSAEIEGAKALIGSSDHLNFDDPQPPTVSRDHVWTDETYQVTADADMEDVSSMQQIERNKVTKGGGKLAIMSAPSLHKATLNATAQLPSLESTQSAKLTNMDAAVSSALPKRVVPSEYIGLEILPTANQLVLVQVLRTKRRLWDLCTRHLLDQPAYPQMVLNPLAILSIYLRFRILRMKQRRNSSAGKIPQHSAGMK
jgi:hypothetical protein